MLNRLAGHTHAHPHAHAQAGLQEGGQPVSTPLGRHPSFSRVTSRLPPKCPHRAVWVLVVPTFLMSKL